MKSIITKILAVAVVSSATSYATANEYRHIVSLSNQIQAKSRALTKEARHYKHTPYYYDLVEDTRELTRLAQHVRVLARNEGSVYHLAADLRLLDACFHRVENLFDKTEAGAAYGVGHVHGNTKHVKSLLNKLEDCIHHLRDDIDAIRRRLDRVETWKVPLPPVVAPVRPVYGWGTSNPGFDCDTGYRSPWGASYTGRRGLSVYGGKYPGSSGIAFGNGHLNFNIGF